MGQISHELIQYKCIQENKINPNDQRATQKLNIKLRVSGKEIHKKKKEKKLSQTRCTQRLCFSLEVYEQLVARRLVQEHFSMQLKLNPHCYIPDQLTTSLSAWSPYRIVQVFSTSLPTVVYVKKYPSEPHPRVYYFLLPFLNSIQLSVLLCWRVE